MLIKCFEDIEAWKEARRLVNMVYDLTDKPLFRKDFGLKEQIQKAAVSCMSNVAEGFDSDTKQQFIQLLSPENPPFVPLLQRGKEGDFYPHWCPAHQRGMKVSYAKRSASEAQSELYAALDRRYITQKEFNDAYNQAKSVRKLANGFIRYLKGNKTG